MYTAIKYTTIGWEKEEETLISQGAYVWRYHQMSMSLHHIQALLGHAGPSTTARYTQLTKITEKDSFATINKLINTLRFRLTEV